MHKCLALLFEVTATGLPSDSPSARWLASVHPASDFTFVFRGDVADKSSLGFYEDDTRTLRFLAWALFSRSFRKSIRRVHNVLKNELRDASTLWIRGPGIIPLLHGALLCRSAAEENLSLDIVLHVCANRMTFWRLVTKPSLTALAKYISGLLALAIISFIQTRSHSVYYTGSQVRNNFRLVTESEFLIDTFIGDKVKRSRPAERSQLQGVKVAFVGRLSKLSPFVSDLYRLKELGVVVDAYGVSDGAIPKGCINEMGFVRPELVVDKLAEYDVLLCPSYEYYEGFPRTIIEGLAAGCHVVVNSDSVFHSDVSRIHEITEFNKSLVEVFQSNLSTCREEELSSEAKRLLSYTKRVVF